MIKSMTLLVATSLLGGCMAFSGPRPVMERGNVLHQDWEGQRGGYLYDRFRQATLAAAGCGSQELAAQAPEGPRPAISCTADTPATPGSTKQDQLDGFMRAGYELIYAECADYFEAMGRRQRGTRVLRATLAPISDLITGIIAIARFQDSQTRDDLLGGLALGSQAASNALNIYDQHFLFGAENIDAVRTLVQDALRAHALASLRANVDHATFGRAANHVIDNQAICGPSRILTLTREAIAAGKIEARAVPAAVAQAAAAAGSTAETTQSDRVEVGVRSPQ